MKRIGITVLAAAFVMGMTASALAGPGCGKAKSGCGKAKAQATVASADGGCGHKAKDGQSNDVIEAGVARVMSSMPHMTYKVGDMETRCCATAKKAADESGNAVQYVVDGKTYTCKQTAQAELAELMRAELPKVVRVAHVVDGEQVNCPMTAAKLASDKHTKVKHMVAGVEFDCDKQAQTVADRLAAKLKDCHGCPKAFAGDCGSAKTASADGAKKGDCAKECDKAKTAAADGAKKGDCAKECDKARTASADGAKKGDCAKDCAKAQQTQTADAGMDETPELANAKLLVREIVEYAAAAKSS